MDTIPEESEEVPNVAGSSREYPPRSESLQQQLDAFREKLDMLTLRSEASHANAPPTDTVPTYESMVHDTGAQPHHSKSYPGPPPVPGRPEEIGSNPTPPNDEELLSKLTEALRGFARPGSLTQTVADRARTLSNLLTNAPRYDGSSEVTLWQHNITDYLNRRMVTESVMRLDILQDCLQGEAKEYYATLVHRPSTPAEFWEAMHKRFKRTPFARLRTYEALKHKPGETYQQFADKFQRASYGLNIPLASQIHHFLRTMRNGASLKKFLVGQISSCQTVRELAEFADQLTADDTALSSASTPAATFQGICNYCKQQGHMSKDCPRKRRGLPPASAQARRPPPRPAAASTARRANAEAAYQAYLAQLQALEEAEWEELDQQQVEEEQEEFLYEEQCANDAFEGEAEYLEDYDDAVIDVLVEAQEKRPLEEQHAESVRQLRSAKRPAPYRPMPQGASGLQAPPTRVQPRPGNPSEMRQVPVSGMPSQIARPVQLGTAPQQPAPGQIPQLRPAQPDQRPGPSYRAPLAPRPFIRQPYRPLGQPAVPAIPKSKALPRVLENSVDVPAVVLAGLVLSASGRPSQLATEWAQKAQSEAKALLNPYTTKANEVGQLQLDLMGLEIADQPDIQTVSALLNPLSTSSFGSAVGYIPLRFPSVQGTLWGLVDTGAQVSVISAGLASFLGLLSPDMSNLAPSPFSVTGYNGTRSYMPLIEVTVRFGVFGGPEREVLVQLCVLDTNQYKLLIGVDILGPLKFVFDDPGRRLFLEHQGRRFSLPLADKVYAFDAPMVKAYLAAVPAVSTNIVEIATVDLEEDEMVDSERTELLNSVETGCLDYADEVPGGLSEVLLLAAQSRDSAASEIHTIESSIIGTISPKLAKQLFPESSPIVNGKHLVVESDLDAVGVLEVASEPLLAQSLVHFYCQSELCDHNFRRVVDVDATSVDLGLSTVREVLSNPEFAYGTETTSGKSEILEQAETCSLCAGDADVICNQPSAQEISQLQFPQPNNADANDGKLVVYSGPMFAGKTTAMLARLDHYKAEGRKVRMVKAACDDRFNDHCITTHGKRSEREGLQVASLLAEVDTTGIEVIAVDELHFYADVVEVVPKWLEGGKVVLATTLDRDCFQQRFFIWDVLESANVQTVDICLSSRCGGCGADAFFTARTSPLHETWVGGAESYLPCCECCFPRWSVFHNPKHLLVGNVPDKDSTIMKELGVNTMQLCESAGAVFLCLNALGEEAANAILSEKYCPNCGAPVIDCRGQALKAPNERICLECDHTWSDLDGKIANPLAQFHLSLVEYLDGRQMVKLGPFKADREVSLASFISEDSRADLPFIIAQVGSVGLVRDCCASLRVAQAHGLESVAIDCEHCAASHLDSGRQASKLHYPHHCLHCGELIHQEPNCVGNPIAKLKPIIPNKDSGLIQFDNLAVMEAQVNSLLPESDKVGHLGTAQLPPASGPEECTREEIQDFLREHQLKPGDLSSLPRRVFTVRAGLKDNPKLVDPQITGKRRQELLQAVLDNGLSFAMRIEDLRVAARGQPFEIDTGDALPIKCKTFRQGTFETDFLHKTVESQMKGGIVAPSSSDWRSPAFVTYQKQYGGSSTPKPRKVVDYRKLNAVTKADCYPLPDIPELLEWLSQFKYFGAADLKSGYWQKPIAAKDACKTAFATPNALVEYRRVSLGLKNAPAYFQREINRTLHQAGISDSRGFIDDLLTGGTEWNHYVENQIKLFGACRVERWLMTLVKLYLAYTEIAALGHITGHGYVRPDPAKVEALQRLQPPTNLTELRAFLGLVGYYRRFISGFALRAKNLTELLKKETPFKMGSEQLESFNALKLALAEVTMLHTPRREGRFRMYTDFCSDAVSACLHQVQEGVEKPVAFASRLCRGPERSLSSAEGELLALVYGLGKFRAYLGFAEFDIITDSSALTSLKTNQNLSGKLARWSVLLSEFNYKLEHKKGAIHKNADGLTRAAQAPEPSERGYLQVWELSQVETFLEDDVVDLSPLHEPRALETMIKEVNILFRNNYEGQQCAQCNQDITRSSGRILTCGHCGRVQHAQRCTEPACTTPYWYCSDCFREIERNGPSDASEDLPLQKMLLRGPAPPGISEEEATHLHNTYQIRRGTLQVDTPQGNRILPTPFGRTKLIEQAHDQLMHAGHVKVAAALEESYYWPGLRRDVKQYCQSCLPCQLQTSVFRRKDRLGGHLTAFQPRMSWSIDCAPGIKTRGGQRKSIVIMVDDFSKFCILVVLDKLDSKSIRDAFLKHVVAVYGRPNQVRTDRGKEFHGHFSAFLESIGVRHRFTWVVAPWTNGRAERMVRTLKAFLKRVIAVEGYADWVTLVPFVMHAINVTVARSVGLTPYEIFFGEQPIGLTPADQLPPLPDQLDAGDIRGYVRALKRRVSALHQKARAHEQAYLQQEEEQSANYPVAGRQYRNESQMAKKRPYQDYYAGQLVMVKRAKPAGHYSIAARGPCMVLEDREQTVVVQWIPSGGVSTESKANVLPLKGNFHL